MPFQSVSFQVPRCSDRLVYDRLKEALGNAQFTSQQITVSLLIGSDPNSQDSNNAKQIEAVLALDSITARSISFRINSQGTVSVNRPMENQKIKGWYDDVSISPGEESDPIRVLNLVKEVRKTLHAPEDKSALDFLTEEQCRYYEAREIALNRQEQMLQRFFSELQRFSIDLTTKLTTDFQHKQVALEEQHAKRLAALDEQHQQRMALVDEREAQLAAMKQEIDDRDSRHVRRDIYKEIKNKFVERSKAFELTKGTRNLRLPIYISSLVLIALLLAGVVYYGLIDSLWTQQQDPWIVGAAIVRQVILSAAFGVTAWFIIRWQNHWFHSHAEEEFKLKRLELDIDRASWVVEMAMEWKDAKGTEIPQVLIERLSRNLFDQDGQRDCAPTPADSLAAAMLRTASAAKVKLGDAVELSFDPKGIKRLDRE